ncbi:MAG: Aclacinomycin methylesterase RdmC [Acidimicrobiales bacterium]|nr:Aclacinomycin methylesterase RdmC [Acidimicrobiales bacterium]
MPFAPSNGIELWYETFGDPAGRPLLLIMGLGAQSIHWEDSVCQAFVDRGFFVLRFDNRDVGLSTKFRDAPLPDLLAALAGDTSSAAYTIDDMADDAAGLLDHLGIASAHVVGASMGGMIAQALAIGHPSRARSLTSIMSTTGDPAVGFPHPEVLPALLERAPADREGFAANHVRTFTAIGSPGYPPDPDYLRDRGRRSFDRCYEPVGVGRQMLAIAASPDRTPGLATITVPTLVIHGESDPLVDVSGGRATAAAVPGARLITIPGMGHDLPRALIGQFVEEISALATAADAK